MPAINASSLSLDDSLPIVASGRKYWFIASSPEEFRRTAACNLDAATDGEPQVSLAAPSS
jgi:hypothetical protein